MRPRLPGLAAALLLAACSVGSTPAPSGSSAPSPDASGAACETTPTPGELPGWGIPSEAPAIIPVPVSSQLECGENRFLFSFLDASNRPIAAPERSASVAFYSLGRDPEQVVTSATGTFVWAIEGARGVYVAHLDFPEAGVWGAEFTTSAPGNPEVRVRLTLDVRVEATTIGVGDRAPASRTLTLDDVGGDVTRISTDQKPVARFYETSIDTALAAKKPFVLVFATPKFCASAQCGPTLDRVKPVAAAFPDVTLIVVEPYELEVRDGSLQPVIVDGGLKPVQAVVDWGLVSEPWIFVVDGDGIVTASFEGIVGDDELRAAVAALR